MASWGDPLGTIVSGVLIRDRGVVRLDVGVALRIMQVCRRLGPCLRPCHSPVGELICIGLHRSLHGNWVVVSLSDRGPTR